MTASDGLRSLTGRDRLFCKPLFQAVCPSHYRRWLLSRPEPKTVSAISIDMHLGRNVAGFPLQVELDCGLHMRAIVVGAHQERGRRVFRYRKKGRGIGPVGSGTIRRIN